MRRLRSVVVARPGAAAVVGYVVVILAFTWPVARRLGNRAVGRAGDWAIAMWDNWWFAHAVAKAQLPFSTNYLFYPHGVSLLFHSISWLTSAIALPLRLLFGAVAAHNLTLLFEMLLCAGSMFALARYLVRDSGAAWLAGFAFAFDPYRVTRALEHPNLANTGFVPLVVLGLLRACRGEGRRFAWLTAGALACVLLTGAHLFVMTGMAIPLVWALEAARQRGRPGPAFWKATLHVALACVLVVGPLALPYATSRQTLAEVIGHFSRAGSTDAAALLVRGPSQLFGAGSRYRFFGEAGSVAYLGWVPLGLSLLAFATRETRRGVWPWFLLFLLFLVLSFGPRLELNHRLYFSLPYRALARFQLVQVLRQPERFNLIARVFFAVSVAWGVAAGKQLLAGRPALWLWCYPLLLLDLFGAPYPMRVLGDNAFYRELRKQGGRGAIVPLPANRESAKRAMLAQTFHERPIVGGMIARPPRSASRYMRQIPLLAALADARPLECKEVRLRSDLERLRHDGVEYFLITHPRRRSRRPSVFRSYFVTKPYYTDKYVEAHRISDLLARPLPCDAGFNPARDGD